MVVRTRQLLPALAALSCGAIALAAEPTTEELKAQVDALQKKVEAMEARQTASADVDATVQRLLDDAQRRSQFMEAEGFTAGYNKGKFLIQSADGNFVLNPNAQLQIRYVANHTDDNGDDSTEDGFEIRRAKFGFDGNVLSKDLKYTLTWATSRSTGAVSLETALVEYKFAENWSVFGGQYKDFPFHEETVSSKRQLAVDRSVLNELIGGGNTDFVQGVGLGWHKDQLRGRVAYTDGAKSLNTNYQDTPSSENFGASGRFEWMALGKNWKEYDQFTAHGDKDDLLVFGAGASFTQEYATPGGTGDTTWVTADVQWDPQAVKGLSAYGAYLGRYADADDAYDQGFLAQAGYLFTDRWEVFGRYDITLLDKSTIDNYQEFTVGLNYYVNGHAAKFTADIVYLPDGAPSESGLGIRETDGDEVVARVQFQLLI